MSEKLLKILLSELTTLRIICQCGGSMEIELSKLKGMNWNLICPGCGKELRKAVTLRGGKDDSWDLLSEAIGTIKNQPGVELAFILPDKGEE